MTDQTAGPCAHAYITSNGVCLHCGEDISEAVAAAVDRLNAAVAAELETQP